MRDPRRPTRSRPAEIYFQDSGARAIGLTDVTLNDIDYLDLGY
jgi:hypothetical protein